MPSSSTSPILIENSNVAEPAVVNASPLIFLSRAGLIYLLQLGSSEIIVPEAVHAEIEVRGHSDPTVQTLANTSWRQLAHQLRQAGMYLSDRRNEALASARQNNEVFCIS